MEAHGFVVDRGEDETTLPSFQELFGDVVTKKKNKRAASRGIERQSDETTGRWTPEEHKLFLKGIMLHGKDWKAMQHLIKTRTLVQIRTHAQKVFKKVGLKRPKKSHGDSAVENGDKIPSVDMEAVAAVVASAQAQGVIGNDGGSANSLSYEELLAAAASYDPTVAAGLRDEQQTEKTDDEGEEEETSDNNGQSEHSLPP